MRQVTACFTNRLERPFLHKNQTQFRRFWRPDSQFFGHEVRVFGALRKTPTRGRRFTTKQMLLGFVNRRYPDPSTSCVLPGPTSLDSPSTSIMKDRYLSVGYAALALWISSGDIAAIRPHRSQPVVYCPASRLWRWGPARHPYRGCRSTSCACYLACVCSVNPLNKC